MPAPAIGYGLAAIGAIGKGINYFNARKAEKEAQSALEAEEQIPYQQYAATGQLNQYYSDALNNTINPQGLTGGEKTTFQTGVDRTINTMASNASRGSGGNLSRYIMGALNPSVISANNQLVAQDAGIRRANQSSAYGRLGTAVNAFQGIKDRNTANEIQRKMMREQYLGQAVLQNKAFQSNTLDSISSDLLGGGLMLGMGGGNRTSTGGANPYTGVSYTGPINGYNNPYFNGTA